MPPARTRTANQSAAIINGQIMSSLAAETNGQNDLSLLEKRLWEAADQLRANSRLKSSEYSIPVLGLIFLRYADYRFTHVEQELKAKQGASSRRTIGKADYQARGVVRARRGALRAAVNAARGRRHRQSDQRGDEGDR